MAITEIPIPPQVYRFPQSKFIDAVRWLPPLSPLSKFAVLATFDTDADTPSLETHSISSTSQWTPHSQWTAPSRISSLSTSHQLLIATSTLSGSLHVLSAAEMEVLFSIDENSGFHMGPIWGVDVMGSECVSVGEDGRVNLVSVNGGGEKGFRRVYDGNGLVGFNCVKWASPSEFVTGGFGFGLQWWDLRRPGADGPVSQFKGNFGSQGKGSGMVHSIDIHPSRKHTCLAGGSSGTVFAWDLRWQQQSIVLSGVGTGEAATHSLSESEVWEVQYDCYTKSSNITSSRVLPAMFCSEDGILAVVGQGQEPVELLAEPCAINSFDIDPQSPSDVICSLEWEAIAIVARL
ncbi:nuclear pore complex protein NUP43-like [Melia azedarach]|uniref:Nuclear pore complex protein NUP43-like n=2 Tax=Melia azedarach TaxID=155640 RepID=A0ACC1XDF6_MELAZ|nr:nuclear pore complex protein NUP43-like [Melia azedarach]KAJ4709522.1 nuclear pore complex protein NUP43-like [Melia azedarach]